MIESGDNSYNYINDSFGIRALTSNVLRNTAMHLAFPYGNFNNGIQKAVLLLHNILRIDINDPGITWTVTKFRVKFSTNEDLAGNPFHLLLIVVSMFLLFNHREPHLILFTLCLTAGFILFSWLLKWQPWHSRLHLPLFILAMPFVGIVLSNSPKRWVLYVVVPVLSFMSLRYLFLNPTRPLIGTDSILTTDRLNQYFSASPGNFNPYQQLSRTISDLQCNDIGLVANIDDWEYPLWVMTEAYGKDIHLEHILVDNPSGILETGFVPCAIVVTYPLQEQTIIYQNKVFVKYRQANHLSLFVLPAQ